MAAAASELHAIDSKDRYFAYGVGPRHPVSWDAQVQKAVDCYNAGAPLLHIRVRDPKTDHISKNFKEYGDLIGRLRQAVPKMVLQVGVLAQ